MSNPTCTNSSLTASCYKTPGAINPTQQKSLLIYAMALELNALGGTNYTNSLSTTLLSDSARLLAGFRQADRDAAAVQIAFNNATAAGASVPSDLNGKIAAVACLSAADPNALDNAYIALLCALGVHKSYPQ